MKAKEILDGCDHVSGEAESEEGASGCVCRRCAERAVEVARDEERKWIFNRIHDLAEANRDMPDGLVIHTVAQRLAAAILRRSP